MLRQNLTSCFTGSVQPTVSWALKAVTRVSDSIYRAPQNIVHLTLTLRTTISIIMVYYKYMGIYNLLPHYIDTLLNYIHIKQFTLRIPK